jgi:hypothetical protein
VEPATALTASVDIEPGARSGVAAVLPLSLLESVRAHDRPGEILEDEDLTVSLLRRLGLKGVVLSQIQRYEQAHSAGRTVPVSDLTNLLQLVLRRPDAEAILRDTGRRVARSRFEGLSGLTTTMLRIMPRSLTFVPLRRATRGLMRGISGSDKARVNGKPLVVQLDGSPPARLHPLGCVLYTGTLEEMVLLYTGAAATVLHDRCVARGDAVCEWRLAEPVRPRE